MEGLPAQRGSAAAAQEAARINRRARKHVPYRPSQAARVMQQASSPSSAARGTTTTGSSATPHTPRTSVASSTQQGGVRVVRLTKGAPLPPGVSREQAAVVAARAMQARGRRSAAAAAAAPSTRLSIPPPPAPRRVLTFAEKVRQGNIPAGMRPEKRQGSGRRRLQPQQSHIQVVDTPGGGLGRRVVGDMGGVSCKGPGGSRQVVLIPAGRRNIPAPPLSLAHPE